MPGPDEPTPTTTAVVDEQQLDRIADVVERHPEVVAVEVAAAEKPQLYVEFRGYETPPCFRDAYGLDLVGAQAKYAPDVAPDADGLLDELVARYAADDVPVVVGIYQIDDPIDVEYLADHAEHELDPDDPR